METALRQDTNNAKNKLNTFSGEAKDRFDDTVSKASSNVLRVEERMKDVAGVVQDKLRSGFSDITDSSIALVKKYPAYTLMGVAAIGLVAGFALRRSGSVTKSA